MPTIPDLPGIGLERLRLQLEPRLPAPALLSVLHGLVRTRDVALDGAWVRLAGHEVRLTGDDERLWTRIAPLLAGAERFRPPRVRDIATLAGVARSRCTTPVETARAHGAGRRGGARPLLSPHHGGEKWSVSSSTSARPSRLDSSSASQFRDRRRQRTQGGDPDPGVFRSPWRDAAPRRSAPRQQASPRSVPQAA